MKKIKKTIAIIMAMIMAFQVTSMPAFAETESPTPTEVIIDLSEVKHISIYPDFYYITENDVSQTMYSVDKYIFVGKYNGNADVIYIDGDGQNPTYNLEFRDVEVSNHKGHYPIILDDKMDINIQAIGENKIVSENTVFYLHQNGDVNINITVPPGKSELEKNNSLLMSVPMSSKGLVEGNGKINMVKTVENLIVNYEGGKKMQEYRFLPSADNYKRISDNSHTYTSNGIVHKEECYPAYTQPGPDKTKHNLVCVCGNVVGTESHENYVIAEPDTDTTSHTHTKFCYKCGEIIAKGEKCVADDKPEYSGSKGVHDYKCKDCGQVLRTEKCVPGDECIPYNESYHYRKCKLCDSFSIEENHVITKNFEIIKEPTETEWGIAEGYCDDCGEKITDLKVVPTGVYYFEAQDKDIDTIYRIYVNGELTVYEPNKENHIATGSNGIEVKAKKTDDIVLTAYVADNDENKQQIKVYEPGTFFPVFEKKDLTGVEPYSILWSNKETADYSALQDSINKIPEDLSKYVKEKVITLLEEINKIVPYLSDQSSVDKWTNDILKALDNLTKTEVTDTEDTKNIRLEEGNHLVITKTGYSLNDGKPEPWTGPYNLTSNKTAIEADVLVESGVHNITLNDLKITKLTEGNPFRINSGAMVNMSLEGENNLESSFNKEENDAAALNVMKNAVLNISGTGLLRAVSNNNGAGIGSDTGKSTGRINIYQGSIEAVSENLGSGLGTGACGAGGSIRIYGGNINANSVENGAGIGGGERGNLENITIYGGEIVSKSKDGAGIGGGYKGSAGDITIYDGTINAFGRDGAGIGVGEYGKNGTIRIYGGDIRAEGDNDAAGIGGSEDTTVDLIEITDGQIEATGDDGAGIGGGDDSDGGKIRISGGIIKANSEDGNAIGGGKGELAGDILISGGIFYLAGDGNDIGSEDSDMPVSDCNRVVIDGGCFFDKDQNLYTADRTDPAPVNSDGQNVLLTVLDITDANGNKVADGNVYIELTDGSKHIVKTVNGQTAMYLPEGTGLKSSLDINKSADFTKLDEVVKKIPKDLSRYTDASVEKVNTILNKINRKATVEDQNMIDILTAELDKAVNELRAKAGRTELSVKNITLSSYFYKVKAGVFRGAYNGNQMKAVPIVKDNKGNVLKAGVDYKVTYSSDKRVSVGDYTFTVKGIGNYRGEVICKLIITPKAVSKVNVRLGAYNNNGGGYDDAYVTWNKSAGADGYYVYMRRPNVKDSSWKLAGTVKGTSLLKKNLSDGYKYEFKVIPYVKADINYKTTGNYKVASVQTLMKTKITSAKKYNKERTRITWTNINGETGYQVMVNAKGKTRYFTISSAASNVKVIRNAKTTFKVRPYKDVKNNSGKTVRVYAPWSDGRTYTLR